MLTDPISGQTVCSCQYDSHILNYQRLAASGGLPLAGMYNPAVASAYGAPDGAFLSGLPGADQLQSSFCPPGVSVLLCVPFLALFQLTLTGAIGCETSLRSRARLSMQ